MTYSIIARDAATGDLGVAVQSHFFAVGAICPWVEPGVGAIATQSEALPSYGPRGLDAMRSGRSASEALAVLVAEDDERERRQVAYVDATGAVAVHTGERCIAEAGHVTGDGFSTQANMMRNTGVPEAMADAFTAATGELSDRLLAALHAAEAAGGDIRGRQSACLLVASAGAVPWERAYDVRVDDHSEPLDELSRLVALHRAYRDGEAFNNELRFWRALELAGAGKVDEARDLLIPVWAEHDGWAILLQRLPAVGSVDDDTVARLLAP
ncbi:MAG: hypothetical protein QOG87_3252 [Actinomycetota bacterium]|jgi:uncharacterized Ntn-hydrolase superfamily protein